MKNHTKFKKLHPKKKSISENCRKCSFRSMCEHNSIASKNKYNFKYKDEYENEHYLKIKCGTYAGN